MGDWRDRLRGDPLPWLLDEADPAVRHLALSRRSLDATTTTLTRAPPRRRPTLSDLIAPSGRPGPAGWWRSPATGVRAE